MSVWDTSHKNVLNGTTLQMLKGTTILGLRK